MNTEFFIAGNIQKVQNKDGKLSKPIIKIAILGIALGLAVMIMAVAIVKGFQIEIRDKVIGFGAHISINNYDDNSSYEANPVSIKQPFYPSLEHEEGVKHIQVFATKPGIIKTDDNIEGVVIKGVGKDFDWDFFKDKIVEGKNFVVTDSAKSNSILVSQQIASKLKLKVGDDLLMYFIQQPPRVRKFKVEGIYKTGLEDFDNLYVIADIAHIQKLNDWTADQVGGFEVLINNFDDLDKISEMVYEKIGYDLNSTNIKENHPQIFDWLSLQNMNVKIILTLMLLVSGINMISALLILILERTNMIGILKALGASNLMIRKIFLINASYLILRGLFWGNLIGISLCLIQKYFNIISLDQQSYYVSTVPILLNWADIILLNIGTLITCLLMLIIPSMVVTRITPVKAIRFN